jgi:hypothetical protein
VSRAGEIAATELERAVYMAALKWCGEKDRETFPDDITYFKHNWRALAGLKEYVRAELERTRT